MLLQQAHDGEFAILNVGPSIATQGLLVLSLLLRSDVNGTYVKNNNNNDDYNNNLVQLGCYSVAVVILHVYRI